MTDAGPARRQPRLLHQDAGEAGGRAARSTLLLGALAGLLSLAGCGVMPAASRGVSTPTAAAAVAPAVPAAWQAERPHGAQVADLLRWWQQFDDPLLAPLIESAQAVSPTLGSAVARLAQARSAEVAAQAGGLPALDLGVSLSRGQADVRSPVGTLAGASLQASWELDLFGAVRAGQAAAQARWQAAGADWHDARVAVAAEVANNYLALRACEAQRAQHERELQSQTETARLVEQARQAGFESPATAALAQGAVAQAATQLSARAMQCQQAVKILVALTGQDEAALLQQLASRTGQLPKPAALAVAEVPAQALQQRPDLFSSARAVEAAAADADQADAQQWPRLSLSGSIGPGWLRSQGQLFNGTLWSIGPLQLSLPLFDAGKRRANSAAAQARYDEAVLAYRGRLREAVREVEDALVRIDGARARLSPTQRAADAYTLALDAAQARLRAGLASGVALEDARRGALQARAGLIDLEREQVAAWIALYRALGGGWSATAPAGPLATTR